MISSWNVNLRAIYDLDYGTHRYLLEGLTEGRHAQQIIYKKYINFLRAIATNRRQCLRNLLKSVSTTCTSVTGANLRRILLDTGVYINPGQTKGFVLNNYIVHKTPVDQEWRIPLLVSLLRIRDSNWEINFDDEAGQLKEDEISALISSVCIG